MHTINSLKDGVSEFFNVDLSSKKRDTKHYRARSIFYKLCFKLVYKPTYQAIGDSVNRNHATVIHSVKNFERDLKFDSHMSDMYDSLKDIYLEFQVDKKTNQDIVKSNQMLKRKVEELEGNVSVISKQLTGVSKYSEVHLLNGLLSEMDEENRFLLLCKLDALYKLNKGKTIKIK